MRLRKSTCKPHHDPTYSSPEVAEVRQVLEQFSEALVADMVGYTVRSVRRWKAGDVPIPFSVWRLLLIELNLAEKGNPITKVVEV